MKVHWARFVLLWPLHVSLAFILPALLTIALMVVYPWMRFSLIVGWFILFLLSLTGQGCTAPNNWHLRGLVKSLLPPAKELGWKYVDRSGFDHRQQAIYVWYPHGHLGIGAFGSIVGGVGDHIWKRPAALCVAPLAFDIPALYHCSLSFGLVRSDLENMKNSLSQGTSLVVLPGGLKEMKMAEPGTMKLIDGRQGLLRLARKLSVPLIPVFSFGENELFDGISEPWNKTISDLLENLCSSLQMPSLASMRTWLGTAQGERPLRIVLGPAFLPADFSAEMGVEWKTHVNLAYEICRPRGAPPITWIPSVPKNRKQNSVLDAEL